MAYEKQTWVDGQSPLNAERMNHIEDGIEQNAAETIRLSEEMVKKDKPLVYIYGDIPTTKQERNAVMRFESKWMRFSAYIEIKCQGSSSMGYPKKNFTVKLYQDEARTIPLKITIPGWKHASNKYVLKANYADPSHARNIITARLWSEIVASRPDYGKLPEELRNSPNNGAIDGFPTLVTTNDTYQGIYTWNIGKDDWLWGMDEDNANHVLLCGETNTYGTGETTSATNFREQWSGTDGEDWSVEVGENNDAVKTSLNALIACVNLPDNECKAQLPALLDIQSAIDYDILNCVDRGVDNVARNLLLGTYDLKKWICGVYDLDMTWGNSDTVGDLAGSEHLGDQYNEQNSLLWEKIETLYFAEMRERARVLRKTVLSYGNIMQKFERFIDVVTEKAYEDDIVNYPDIPRRDRMDAWFFRDFVRDRLAYFDSWIANLGTSDAVLPVADYSLNAPVTFADDGGMIDTGVNIIKEDTTFTVAIDFTGAANDGEGAIFYSGLAETSANSNFSIITNAFYSEYLVKSSYGGNGTEYDLIRTGAQLEENARTVIVVRHEAGSETVEVAVRQNGEIAHVSGAAKFSQIVSESANTAHLGSAYKFDWSDMGIVLHRPWFGTIHRCDIYTQYLTDAQVELYANTDT